MIRSLWLANLFWNRRSCLSSRASINSWSRASAFRRQADISSAGVRFEAHSRPTIGLAFTSGDDPFQTLLTLREKLIKIGTKVVRHGRYITFQLAEVAISRSLFATILRLIDGLQPARLPP